jgi:hypothetical protein
VVAGEIKRLSVSAIATFDPLQRGGCNRRWWFKYVAGVPEPPTKAATKGGDVHRQIEHYLKTGEDVLGAIARPVREYVSFEPHPQPYEVERRFDGELTAAGVPLTGYIDYVDWLRSEVRDWKTTGQKPADLPKGEDLIKTIQMPGYGKWLLGKVDGPDDVRLTHVYLSTKHPGNSYCRTALWPRLRIVERWNEVEDLVQIRMKPTATAEKSGDVEPNFDACNAFGRCAYTAICPKPKSVAIHQLFGVKPREGTEMGLFDRLQSGGKTDAVAVEKAKLVAAEKQIVTLKGEAADKAIVTLKGEAADKAAGEKLPMGAAYMTAGVTPPDAPKSGETGPKAEPMKPEEFAKQSAEVQKAHAEVLGALAEEKPKAKRGRRRTATTDAGTSFETTASAPFAKTKIIRRIGLAHYSYLEFEAEANSPEEYADALERMAEFTEGTKE